MLKYRIGTTYVRTKYTLLTFIEPHKVPAIATWLIIKMVAYFSVNSLPRTDYSSCVTNKHCSCSTQITAVGLTCIPRATPVTSVFSLFLAPIKYKHIRGCKYLTDNELTHAIQVYRIVDSLRKQTSMLTQVL